MTPLHPTDECTEFAALNSDRRNGNGRRIGDEPTHPLITEETPIRTNVKTILAIVAITAAVVVGYLGMLGSVRENTRRIDREELERVELAKTTQELASLVTDLNVNIRALTEYTKSAVTDADVVSFFDVLEARNTGLFIPDARKYFMRRESAESPSMPWRN